MANRTDTCNVKCPFWKKYKDHCPNHVKGMWRTVEGHVYETKDCAPKRSMILCQQIYDHMIDVRQDYNQVRNAASNLMMLVGKQNNIDIMIEHEDVEEAKLIEE